MKNLNFYQERAAELIQQDTGKDQMLAAMEQMWQNRWQLPEEISGLGWIHKVVGTDPHDALRAGVRIDKSTVPRILQTGDFPAGTTFATLNLATQSGLKSLSPYKELAEQALAAIFQQMIDWISLDGRPILAVHQRSGQAGEQIVLDPAIFDPARLYIEATLSADVPADRAARIEAAATAVRELGYSRTRTRALEFIGETDPALILAERQREDKKESE